MNSTSTTTPPLRGTSSVSEVPPVAIQPTSANAVPSDSYSSQVNRFAIRLFGKVILPVALFASGIALSKLLSNSYKSPALEALYSPLAKTVGKTGVSGLCVALAKSCWHRADVALDQDHTFGEFLFTDLLTKFTWSIADDSTTPSELVEEQHLTESLFSSNPSTPTKSGT